MGYQMGIALRKAWDGNLTWDDILSICGALGQRMVLSPVPQFKLMGAALYAISVAPDVIESILAGNNVVVQLPEDTAARFLTSEINALVQEAKGSASVRTALLALSPLTQESLLFEEIALLSRYDSETGEGALTDAWILDRAKMLHWLLEATKYGVFEAGALEVRSAGGVAITQQYEDLSLKESVRVGPKGLATSIAGMDREWIIFGTNGNDKGDDIDGAGQNDRLYGWGGMT